MPLEVTDGQFQDVRLLQLGVLRLTLAVLGILALGGLEDEGLQDGQALVDARPPTLLHEWFVCPLADVLRRGHILRGADQPDGFYAAAIG